MSKFRKDFDWDQIQRDQEADEEIIYVSKSEIKRDAQDIKKFANYLLEMPLSQFNKLTNLDDTLHNALVHGRGLKLEARRRQLLYISKLFRKRDMEDIKAQLENIEQKSFSSVEKSKRTEKICNQLLLNRQVLTKLKEQYPELDTTLVNNMLTSLQKEDTAKNKQKLFNYLNQII